MPNSSRRSVSEKSHQSSSFCGTVLGASGDSRACSGCGVVVSFSLGAPTPASVATVPGPSLARRDPRDSCRCTFLCFFFFFSFLGALTSRASRSSRGTASDCGGGDGTGGLMLSGALHHEGMRSD